MTSEHSCDLAVLGGGPGGLDAAFEAASLGLSVVLVEMAELGGTCLNRGCIPTKLFLGATDPVAGLAAQSKLRLGSGSIDMDLSAMQKRKGQIVSGSRKAVNARLGAAGIRRIQGRGRLVPDGLLVETEDGQVHIKAARTVLATGSSPAFIPGMGPDGESLLDSDMLLDLAEAPGSLAIVGGGAIGLEMGRIFSRLGAKISVVEAMDRMAPWEDPEVSKAIAQMAKRDGWKLHLGARVSAMSTRDGKARLELESGDAIEADKALLATGRAPNTADVGLEAMGLSTGPGRAVQVDDNLMASDTVYAVGDVNGKAMLAHAASHQGRFAARHAAGKTQGPYESGPVPWCIYGHPESLRVGLTAEELVKAGRPALVGKAALAANPIAQAHAATGGFVKVAWEDGRVAGICAVGYGVSHLSTLASVVVGQAWTREDVQKIIFAHPTLDEALEQALLTEPKPA